MSSNQLSDPVSVQKAVFVEKDDKDKRLKSRSKWSESTEAEKGKNRWRQAQQYASLTVPKVSQSKMKDLHGIWIYKRESIREKLHTNNKMQKSKRKMQKLKSRKIMNEQFLAFIPKNFALAFCTLHLFYAYSKESQICTIKEVRERRSYFEWRLVSRARHLIRQFCPQIFANDRSILFQFQKLLKLARFWLQISYNQRSWTPAEWHSSKK